MLGTQPRGVREHDADTAGELEILKHERYAHGPVSYAGVPVASLPYALPDPDAPLRVTFVGQRSLVEPHLLREPAGGVTPAFIDFRDGADWGPVGAELDVDTPDVVVVLRPDVVPAGALAGLPAPVLGISTEPLPNAELIAHPNLDYGLQMLRRADRRNFDRVLVTDPLCFHAAATAVPAWRVHPLPVDDRLYAAPRPAEHPPRAIFIGHSTVHRERSIVALKHLFDVRHYAHALLGDELIEALASADIGLSLLNDYEIVRFQPQMLVLLAAGLLVIAEEPGPGFGLEPGIHYVQVRDMHDLDLRMHQLVASPDAYERVRLRGHHFAQQFRASRVWPQLLRDLVDDLRTFGTHRTPAVAGSAA